MTTKLSPDAAKMLKSIQKYFEDAFKNNVYSHLFRREFYHLFKLEHASYHSLLGSNDAYIFGLGIIDCWDFDKNIENIVSLVNKNLQEKINQIRSFESFIPIVEQQLLEGKIDATFMEAFQEICKEIQKWKETKENKYIYLPMFLSQLEGNITSDFQVVKKEVCEKIKRKKQYDSEDLLYQQLCEWINSPSTKAQFGERRWNAMKDKLALQETMWFAFDGFKDLESAKKAISEVFYPDQEQYYRQLEKWAKNEIVDKKCSDWIDYYLWNGRTIPVRQVKVLKYKGNIEKGKAFLLSKYEEKLEWDRKKQKEREFRNNSLFDSYDENYNSFQQICLIFENKFSLFPMCIGSNVKANNIPLFTMFSEWRDGIKIQHDSIHYNMLLEDLTLSSTNRFFYTYLSKYKKTRRKYIIYSDRAFQLIKDYLTATLPKISFNDNIACCMTILDYTSEYQIWGITTLLSYSKEDYSPSPIVEMQFNKKESCLASSGFQNTLGYRVFTNSAIFHIAKAIDYPINLSLDKVLSDAEFENLTKAIESKIDELSFEDKYLCHFIDSKRYKFPTDQMGIFDVYRSSRRVNLFHNVQHHYSTPVFQDYLLPFGKIVYQYKNFDFQKNTDMVGLDFYRYKDDKNMWLDKENKLFLINLRVLLYINWVFVSNETGKTKKLSTLWLYCILYRCYCDAYQKDKKFFSMLMTYTLIQNERIFLAIIDSIQTEEKIVCDFNKYDSFTIFYNIVQYYSKGFEKYERGMSYMQLQFLNNGKRKYEVLNGFKKQTDMLILDNEKVILFAKQMFEYINRLLVNDEYPHTKILDLFFDMKPFEVPSNFRYERKRTNNYIDYNGDYTGTYAHDVMGYSNEDIDTIFDGDPNAYWNID